MDEFFKNHEEQIAHLLNRSRKDKNNTFVKAQKGIRYELRTYNGKVIDEFVQNIEGINVHQISSDGLSLSASSDRMYLADIGMRLHATLEDIRKAYKSHKIHRNVDAIPSNSLKESSENITFQEQEGGNEYFRELAQEIYEKINSLVGNEISVYLELDYIYGIWHISRPQSKSTLLEEHKALLHYVVETKSSNSVLLSTSLAFHPNEISSGSEVIDTVMNDIRQLSDILSLTKTTRKTQKINPKVIVVDETLANEAIHSIFQTNDFSFAMQNYDMVEVLAHPVGENSDKFGFELPEESNLYPLRQHVYHERPTFAPRGLRLRELDSVDIDDRGSIAENLSKIAKYLNTDSILYLHGSTKSMDNQTLHDATHIVLSPAVSLYRDGAQIYHINVDMVSIPKKNCLKILGGNDRSPIRVLRDKVWIGMPRFTYAVYEMSDQVFLI